MHPNISNYPTGEPRYDDPQEYTPTMFCLTIHNGYSSVDIDDLDTEELEATLKCLLPTTEITVLEAGDDFYEDNIESGTVEKLGWRYGLVNHFDEALSRFIKNQDVF